MKVSGSYNKHTKCRFYSVRHILTFTYYFESLNDSSSRGKGDDTESAESN